MLEKDKIRTISPHLEVNKVTIFGFNESELWSSSMLCQRLLKKFGDGLIDDVWINNLDTNS